MLSVRVTSSIVGTNAAEFPNVKFWKMLVDWYVSGCHNMFQCSDSTNPLDATTLVIFAYALTNAGTDALWKHSS